MRDVKRISGSREDDVWKGLAAGLLGGLVASWTMDRFQDLWLKLSERDGKSQSERSAQREPGNGSTGRKHPSEEQDDTTVKAASAISEGIFGHQLTKSEKKIAGPAVHYALGTAVGGLYGAAAELEPNVSAGAGLPFGAAFWLVVDETAVPLLGLSKEPTQYPVSTHVYGVASHLVYGVTTDVVRRGVRSVL